MLNATTRNTQALSLQGGTTQGDRLNYKSLKVELVSNNEMRYSHVIKT